MSNETEPPRFDDSGRPCPTGRWVEYDEFTAYAETMEASNKRLVANLLALEASKVSWPRQLRTMQAQLFAGILKGCRESYIRNASCEYLTGMAVGEAHGAIAMALHCGLITRGQFATLHQWQQTWRNSCAK